MLGNIARQIAAGVIGNATVAPGKVAKLAFPPAHVGRKFVDEDDWMALTAFLKIEPCSGRFGIRHCVSPHPQFASGKCRNRKTDRFAIARLLASCPCVAWRAMTDAPVVIAAESSARSEHVTVRARAFDQCSNRPCRFPTSRLRLGDQAHVPKLDAKAQAEIRGHRRSSRTGRNSR